MSGSADFFLLIASQKFFDRTGNPVNDMVQRMTLQNRVTPYGDIIISPSRGMFMGNRGCLHNRQRQLTKKRWAHRAWIICQLEFKDRKRVLMQPNRYTELFFLDEATALAAGHRPCSECRRDAYKQFQQKWISGNAIAGGRISAPEMDKKLQTERVSAENSKNTYQALISDLPDAVFISIGREPYLKMGGLLFPWSPEGYGKAEIAAKNRHVEVLTPQSTVNVLKAGYSPVIHVSACAKV